QPIIQPAQQLGHTQRLHPRRSQLDRQRHPVQPAHQPGHLGAVLTSQREPRIRRPGPVSEQHHRPRRRDVIDSITLAAHRQPRPPPSPAAPGPSPGPPHRPGPAATRCPAQPPRRSRARNYPAPAAVAGGPAPAPPPPPPAPPAARAPPAPPPPSAPPVPDPAP